MTDKTNLEKLQKDVEGVISALLPGVDNYEECKELLEARLKGIQQTCEALLKDAEKLVKRKNKDYQDHYLDLYQLIKKGCQNEK